MNPIAIILGVALALCAALFIAFIRAMENGGGIGLPAGGEDEAEDANMAQNCHPFNTQDNVGTTAYFCGNALNATMYEADSN